MSTESGVVQSDGKRQRLEDCLGSFLQGLREAASQIKANREQRRLDAIRWEEERKQRAEQERLMETERRKEEKLINDANNWNQANIIRDYISRLEAVTEEVEQLPEWIKWAKEHVNRLDPICSPDEIPFLSDEHRTDEY